MKFIRRSFLIVSILSTLGLASFSRAQTAPTNSPPAIPPGFEDATNQANALTPFNLALNLLPAWDPTATNTFANSEFTLSSAPLWKTMTASGTTPYNSTEADYFFTRNIGAGAELISLGNGQGSSTVDTANLAFTLRKDIGNIAGYLLVNGGYDFNRGRPEGAAGPGIVYGYRTHVRLFVDTRFQFEENKVDVKTHITEKGTGFLTRVGMQIPF